MANPYHQLILAFFDDESSADAAVTAMKSWDDASPDIQLNNIGVLVKDDSGKIKTHKLGPRRTVTGAVLFALVAVLTGGASLLGGLVVGGIVGSLFRKGLGIQKDDLARIDQALSSGQAAVAIVADPEQATAIQAKLRELGGKPEAHALESGAVEQAQADAAATAPAEAPAPSLDPEKLKAAAEVFLYGYAMVYNLTEMAKFSTASNLLGYAVPYNTFGYARHLLGPDAKFVSPNNDTLYTLAICDLRAGPLVLHVPDTANRYYVLQFVDAWTNNFAYIGKRATGTAEAKFLLAPADYAGDVPDGMTVVRVPTAMFAIVGRVALDGEADLPAVHALQDQFTLAPLTGQAADAPGVPLPDARVSDDLKWWDTFRLALAAFPPPAADAPFMALCEQFGLTATESPFVTPNPDTAQLLIAAQHAGLAKIEELMQAVTRTPNGWQDTMHLFDYNLDHFEIGTLDSADWKIPDRTKAYAMRAVIARAGLWGNHGYEADYQIIFVDSDGQPLDSAHRYELKLPQQPPVGAFWSLTMYDVPEFYLVANPINRYSIGDRTPGLKIEADGSLTIYMQKDSPAGDLAANWLPTPQSGGFRPIMRMYMPGEAVLNHTFVLPAIQRVD